MNSHNTILVVDDTEDILMLLEFDLIQAGYKVITAHSGKQAIEVLSKQAVDLVLLDFAMPNTSGMEVLTHITNLTELSPPVIMLASATEESGVIKALDLGAEDYVIKPYINKVLLARVRNALKLKEKTYTLETLLRTDSLTHVNNRVGYEELANKVLSHAKRNKHRTAVAMLDIDHFKTVNDTYGHEAGDRVLIEFTQHLVSSFRDYDIIGRIGGEEFAICMPNVSIDSAFDACERFRLTLSTLVIEIQDPEQSDVTITVSIGLTITTNDDLSLEDLMRDADKLMYQAKSLGRNKTIVNPSLLSDKVDFNDNKPKESDNLNTNELGSTSQDKYPGIEYDIGVNNVLGDESLFEEILVMFYQDHGEDKQKLMQAINDNDELTIKSLVHTLKGVACSIGAMDLFNHTKALDVAANEQNAQEFDYLFKPVALELDRVLKGIEEKLAGQL